MAKTTSRTAAAARDTGAVDEELPAPDSSEQPAPEPEPGAPAPEAAAEERLPPGVYEYSHGADCVYPHVPLTCHAFHPAVDETETTPAVPEQPATVFDWATEGPPSDGRWAKTRKKPTQAADNAGGLLNSKE